MRQFICLSWQAMLALFLLCLMASAQASIISLTDHWEYRWGESPIDENGAPAWASDTLDDTAWQAIGFPSNPPGRNGRHHAWFRTTLPAEVPAEGEWRDPVLYIYSVDLITEVYLEGERIYRYGDFNFDDRGEGRFAGWPWHMIELPLDFAGKPLYFRIYSNYTDIGLWGEIKLMERADLLGYLLRHSAVDLIISLTCLLLALLAGVFTVIQSGTRYNFAPVALFGCASGIMILADTQASQLLIERPLLWDYLAAGGYYTLPIAIGLLLEHWYTDTRTRLIRRIWQFHLLYLVVALGAALAGWVNLSTTFPIFDLLLIASLGLLTMIIAPRLRQLDAEQKAILASHALFGLLLVADMAVAHGLLPWWRVPVSTGALVFVLAIVAISLFEYSRTHKELKRLNLRLEQEVAQRTGELQTLVKRLETFSYTDPLTGLHNRRYFTELLEQSAAQARRQGYPLTLVMIDIDHFKRINDLYGHEAGDSVLAAIAKRLTQHFREADVICRLGGEEFAVLMHDTEASDVQERTQTLLEALACTVHHHQETPVGTVTISCGIASYPLHADDPLALVGLADKALYTAKHAGRARTHVYA
ncbi:GGDEF domain-containing protein [Halomonas sp. I1]|uniref:GGDEF domain-containing protein n=1 Tax=Halomonas sp. I1 TaxID=393536 RepID=UPI0028E09AA3|nr:GGDEF domain-containing protein [Halomonas sp. I1]MDT8893642.1 GGDEF domain-containing protein [Halomonas sp. I1]